jgi:hypothetical protein
VRQRRSQHTPSTRPSSSVSSRPCSSRSRYISLIHLARVHSTYSSCVRPSRGAARTRTCSAIGWHSRSPSSARYTLGHVCARVCVPHC